MANKLELTWYGKYEKNKIEPRILIEKEELSNMSADVKTQNMLIHGDNLLALKSLESKYSGEIKCIYIDPPYNTGAAFEHYDDNLQHSIWLSLMKMRLDILYNLLSKKGLIFVQIDDNEQAYLTVLMDEIFGRNNRINTICVNMSNMSGVKVTAAMSGKRFPKVKEYILVYCKEKESYKLEIPKRTKQKWDNEYNYIIPEITLDDYMSIQNEDFKEIEQKISKMTLVPLKDYMKKNKIKEDDTEWKYDNSYRIVSTKPNAALLKKCNDISFDTEIALITTSQGLKKFITTKYNKETKTARIEIVFAKANLEVFFGDHWDDIVTTGGVGQEGNVEFKNSKKPEKLLERIIRASTKENDIVLDSFLGSGTTCAVAHKMNRRWIGIEMGEQAYTHCKNRLDNIIAGNDHTGITKLVDWKGGGGYKFYELAPTLINIDCFGQPVINNEYNAQMLASAVALHEGFKYEPSAEYFWKQSKANENSYLYVTTRHITSSYLDLIINTMKEDEFLIIACTSFESNLNKYNKNIVLKKIPQMLLDKCDFGKENYNLNIINPPICEDIEEGEE